MTLRPRWYPYLELVPVDEPHRPSSLSKLRGHAGEGLSTDEIMALTRGDE